MEAKIPEQFRWFTPRPKAKYFISIRNRQDLRLNEKLRARVPDFVAIGVGPDGKTLAIRGQADGYKLPKSGTVHDKDLIAHLLSLGVEVPAKYRVEEREDGWFAVWMPLPPAALKKRTPTRRRKKGLESVMDELKELQDDRGL